MIYMLKRPLYLDQRGLEGEESGVRGLGKKGGLLLAYTVGCREESLQLWIMSGRTMEVASEAL